MGAAVNDGRKTTVLCVDDSASVRGYLQHLLADDGRGDEISTVVASDAMEALAILSDRKVDLVITDHHMPIMTGVDLVREARFRKYFMPMILLTQDTSEEMRQEARSIGVTKLLTKSASSDQILACIRALLH